MLNPVSYEKGDASNARPSTLIMHVVNNHGGWGAGFVLALNKRYPHVENDYRLWYRRTRERGPLLKLGTTQFVVADQSQNIWVANMCAQTLNETYLPGEIPLDYCALQRCISYSAEFADAHGLSIQAPRFGSGLAGGDWDVIQHLIQVTVRPYIPVTIKDL